RAAGFGGGAAHIEAVRLAASPRVPATLAGVSGSSPSWPTPASHLVTSRFASREFPHLAGSHRQPGAGVGGHPRPTRCTVAVQPAPMLGAEGRRAAARSPRLWHAKSTRAGPQREGY